MKRTRRACLGGPLPVSYRPHVWDFTPLLLISAPSLSISSAFLAAPSISDLRADGELQAPDTEEPNREAWTNPAHLKPDYTCALRVGAPSILAAKIISDATHSPLKRTITTQLVLLLLKPNKIEQVYSEVSKMLKEEVKKKKDFLKKKKDYLSSPLIPEQTKSLKENLNCYKHRTH